jgi:hypothetical protein
MAAATEEKSHALDEVRDPIPVFEKTTTEPTEWRRAKSEVELAAKYPVIILLPGQLFEETIPDSFRHTT